MELIVRTLGLIIIMQITLVCLIVPLINRIIIYILIQQFIGKQKYLHFFLCSSTKCFDLTFTFYTKAYCVTECPSDGTIGVENVTISEKAY